MGDILRVGAVLELGEKIFSQNRKKSGCHLQFQTLSPVQLNGMLKHGTENISGENLGLYSITLPRSNFTLSV